MRLLKLVNVNGGVPCDKIPHAFYPEDISDPELRAVATKAAKATCRACPIIEECFTFAIETQQKYGVWGGTSPDER